MSKRPVRISVPFEHPKWMRLRRIAEERRGNGRTSVAAVIREMVEDALSQPKRERTRTPQVVSATTHPGGPQAREE